jgi:hypothetical protein
MIKIFIDIDHVESFEHKEWCYVWLVKILMLIIDYNIWHHH